MADRHACIQYILVFDMLLSRVLCTYLYHRQVPGSVVYTAATMVLPFIAGRDLASIRGEEEEEDNATGRRRHQPSTS